MFFIILSGNKVVFTITSSLSPTCIGNPGMLTIAVIVKYVIVKSHREN